MNSLIPQLRNSTISLKFDLMDARQSYTYTHIFISSIMKFALTMEFISLVEGKAQTDLSNKEKKKKTVTVKKIK